MKIAEKYQIMTIPTLILFKDGNASQPLVAPKNRGVRIQKNDKEKEVVLLWT